jgi:hypothetical protein
MGTPHSFSSLNCRDVMPINRHQSKECCICLTNEASENVLVDGDFKSSFGSSKMQTLGSAEYIHPKSKESLCYVQAFR